MNGKFIYRGTADAGRIWRLPLTWPTEHVRFSALDHRLHPGGGGATVPEGCSALVPEGGDAAVPERGGAAVPEGDGGGANGSDLICYHYGDRARILLVPSNCRQLKSN